jgi:hypothetical protein
VLVSIWRITLSGNRPTNYELDEVVTSMDPPDSQTGSPKKMALSPLAPVSSRLDRRWQAPKPPPGGLGVGALDGTRPGDGMTS